MESERHSKASPTVPPLTTSPITEEEEEEEEEGSGCEREGSSDKEDRETVSTSEKKVRDQVNI